ncbi:Cloroperoxidase [Aspergillus bertholletiae]|uniref:Cloroperoxidase n=1 Tax=Aspergillus bertholletiae TaxID=1226010 RepID=A0A5N7B6I5_9EURO|nr:Cloroperoxidase [Aspergillus bertholletiae]
MRTFRAILPLVTLGLGSLVRSFPTHDNLLGIGNNIGHIDKRCPYSDTQYQAKAGVHKRLLVDSMASPIDLTGDHEFQPPDFENGDQRGPCPGLNALANHAYIPRSGVVSVGYTSFLNSKSIGLTTIVYGMGVDLAMVLGVMGTVWTGNPLSLDPSFSIGGRDTGVNNLLGDLGNLLGEPQGLIGSHNFIESDSSNTRDDLYTTGNNYALNMSKFMEWYDMSTDGTFSMDLMAKRAKIRMDQTKQTNPEFYYGPVTGLISRNAGYLFPARLFRNYSQVNPEGVLTKEIVRNFFAIYGEEGNFTYREGWERIPENWYKTPVDYGLVQLNLDTLDWLLKYPELGSIGGNTGTVNSFMGIDLFDVTGGIINLTTLLKENNLLCFAFEVLKFLSPNALAGLYKTLAIPLEMIADVISTPLLNFSCPAFKDMQIGGKPFWEAIQDDFPGAAKSGGAF